MRALLFVTAAFLSIDALAQEPSSDSGAPEITINSLTERDLQGLQNGRGMGMGRVAELNGYPGPRHVLELANELELSHEQIEATQLIFAEMRIAAVATGAEIIEAESRLDQLFAAHEADPASVQTALTQIGVMRARLRFVHIEAHMKMRELLTNEQIDAYDLHRADTPGQMQGHGNGQHRQQAGQDQTR